VRSTIAISPEVAAEPAPDVQGLDGTHAKRITEATSRMSQRMANASSGVGRPAVARAGSSEEACAEVIERLRKRQPEIEAAIFAHVRAVSGLAGIEDAEYQAGLVATIVAVVDYSFTCIEQGEECSEPIPPAAIAQARRSARNGVSLDTVVLRYIAGHRLLGEFVMEEVDHSGLASNGYILRLLRTTQEAVLERLAAAIASEYRQEHERVGRSAGQRRRERVQRLLAGEPVDADKLDYELDAWHLGMIATGAGAEKAIRGLADHLGCQLLSIVCGDATVWAWFGGRRRIAVTDVEHMLSSNGAASVSLTIGEPGHGVNGWRLTHLQAQEALWVAMRSRQRVTRYADVLLVAPLLRNEVPARSLEEIFLAPLDSPRNGGQVLRQTLRALFATGHNIKAAAAMLEVDRGTVRNRRRTIEQRLGRPLHRCQAELEVALRLEQLHEPHSTLDAPLTRQLAQADSHDVPIESSPK
jgi:PucR C-terminal helix-turn-helix domain